MRGYADNCNPNHANSATSQEKQVTWLALALCSACDTTHGLGTPLNAKAHPFRRTFLRAGRATGLRVPDPLLLGSLTCSLCSRSKAFPLSGPQGPRWPLSAPPPPPQKYGRTWLYPAEGTTEPWPLLAAYLIFSHRNPGPPPCNTWNGSWGWWGHPGVLAGHLPPPCPTRAAEPTAPAVINYLETEGEQNLVIKDWK